MSKSTLLHVPGTPQCLAEVQYQNNDGTVAPAIHYCLLDLKHAGPHVIATLRDLP